MTWYYKDSIIDEIEPKYKAFVYLITNLKTGKKYIGKKLTEFTKTTVKKGKRKKIKYESDWRDYWSSSAEVQKDVNELGQENFKREIIHFCLNKGSASYFEAKEQFLNEVLENPDQWYNGQIQVRVHRTHVKK